MVNLVSRLAGTVVNAPRTRGPLISSSRTGVAGPARSYIRDAGLGVSVTLVAVITLTIPDTPSTLHVGSLHGVVGTIKVTAVTAQVARLFCGNTRVRPISFRETH